MPNYLNLGCGLDIRDKWINHDLIKHNKHIKVWNLNETPWPWGKNTIDRIDAISVFEHLELTLIETLNECWRILKPTKELHIKYPLFKSCFIHEDPTHRWFWGEHVCDFVDPTTKYGKGAPYYTPFKWTIISRRMSERNCWVNLTPIKT